MPFAASEDDLCHFYQDTAQTSRDEHVLGAKEAAKSKG